MRFLLDMNLPPAIAARLQAEGHDAIHGLNAGYGELSDYELFERAANDARIVVTFDLDFGEIGSAASRPTLGVVLLRLRSARQSSLWDRLRVAIAEAGEAMEAGALVVVEDARIRIRRMPPKAD
jgi:predicted nuclease of predicted toxin-antitoxin system